MDRRALDGVKVVDITQLIAGPLCGRMLADLGAEIIKIDRLPSPNGVPVRSASAGPALNLGKRSIAIDLNSEQGSAVARDLIARADVVIENFRPGVLDRLGLGYEQLSADHPELIFTSISGFGQEGSQADRRAFGSTGHAEAGLLWLQQRALGQSPCRRRHRAFDVDRQTALRRIGGENGQQHDRHEPHVGVPR